MALSPALSTRLEQVVESEISSVPSSAELTRAAERLSRNYRSRASHNTHAPLDSAADRAVYLAVRMPATLAAVTRALDISTAAVASFAPASLLDLGAGPGTAALASLSQFPSITTAALLERDAAFLDIARRLLGTPTLALRADCCDLASAPLPHADLVICSYALNELAPEARGKLIERAWRACSGVLLLIEPGSRAGFANLLAARDFFIAQQDAQIAAPCPGHMPCSLAVEDDWCHFSARVQRSAIHRRLKHAELSYEDEKFSFLAIAKPSVAVTRAQARIVRRPEKLTGHVKLDLCTPDLLQLVTITKKHGALYKIARKAEWGDSFDYPLAAKQKGSD